MPLKKHAPKSRKLKKAAAPVPITNYFELVKEGESAPFYINASREDIVAKANVVAKTGKTVNVFFVGRRLIGFCTETFQLSPTAFSDYETSKEDKRRG